MNVKVQFRCQMVYNYKSIFYTFICFLLVYKVCKITNVGIRILTILKVFKKKFCFYNIWTITNLRQKNLTLNAKNK